VYVDVAGSYLVIEALQTSGGSLTIDRTQSFVNVVKAL
jgi:hypothetical protein